MRLALAAVLIGAAVGVATAFQIPMRAGEWELEMNMQMPGMPAMPPMKMTQCVTPEQLAKDPASGLPRGMMQDGKQACSVSDYKQEGSTVSWKMSCEGEMKMTGTGELTFKGDSYTGVMSMTMPQGAMTMKVAGRRLGECTGK